MACVALKRASEFDSMYASPSKRARYAGPVRSVTVTSPDRALPFADLRRKMTPKKTTAPASSLPQEIRGHRIGRQLKFDEAVPRTPEHIVIHGDKREESKDQPALFTFSQLKLICERRLREQAQNIREDYERILHDKLSEQYSTFVKFTHDQIMRGNYKPGKPPSYLS